MSGISSLFSSLGREIRRAATSAGSHSSAESSSSSAPAPAPAPAAVPPDNPFRRVWQNQQQRQQQQQQQQRQKGPPPASRRFLATPDITVKEKDLEEDRACPICLDDHEVGGKALQLPCRHLFHRSCVLPWLEKTCSCPVCRFEVESADLVYEAERKRKMSKRQLRFSKSYLQKSSVRYLHTLAQEVGARIPRGAVEKCELIDAIAQTPQVVVYDSDVEESETASQRGDASRPPPPALSSSSERLMLLQVQQLKSILMSRGHDIRGCVEKRDLVDRIINLGIVLPSG